MQARILSALLLFLIIATFVILKSVRDALFLSEYSARILPYFMLGTAVAVAAGAPLFIRLYKSLSLLQAVILSFTAFYAGTLLFWLALTSGLQWSIAGLYIWVGLFQTLAPVQAWSVIGERLMVRQAKRSIGLIAGGGVAGSIAGGFLAEEIVEGWSVSSLLPVSAGIMLLALVVVLLLARAGERKEVPDPAMEGRQVRRSFVVLILIVVATGSLVTTFADFEFKVIAQNELPTARELAIFFGSFYFYLGIASLFFQLLVTPFLIKRLGAPVGLAILPAALMVGNVMVIGAASLLAAVVLKGSEQLFKHTVERSSLELVYLAMPERVKVRVKSLIDTVGVRFSEAVAAGVLVLLFSVGNSSLTAIAGLSILFLLIWIVSSILVGRGYPQVLEDFIEHRPVDLGASGNALDADFYRLLSVRLKSSDPEAVTSLLELLHGSGDRHLGEELAPLLEHSDATIRLKTIRLLFDQKKNMVERVEKLLSDPDLRVRMEAIHYMSLRLEGPEAAKMQRFYADPNPTVQAAAFAFLLNQEDETAHEFACTNLEGIWKMAVEAGKEAPRLEIAHLLEHVQPSDLSTSLYKRLLTDPVPEVRKAVLQTIERTRPQGLIPVLMTRLRDASLTSEVMSALSAYGESLLPQLKATVSGSAPGERKKFALKLAARIDGPRPLRLLLETAQSEDINLRFSATKALNRLRKRRSLEEADSQFRDLLDREIDSLKTELRRCGLFSPRPEGLMRSVFIQRQQWARERVFRALGLLYNPDQIYSAYVSLVGESERRADAALEYLDTVLKPEDRNRIMALLEFSSGESLSQIGAESRRSVLLEYLDEGQQLAVSAGLVELQPEELQWWERSEISKKVLPEMGLVHETLNWRLAELDGSEKQGEKRRLTTIQKIENLGKVDIFSRLGPNELLLIANQSEEVEYQEGDVIYKEGDLALEIFSLVEGTLELQRASGESQVVRAGESFGTLSVLSGHPRLHSARTLQPCICLKVGRESFWEIIEDYPEVSRGIFQVLVQRILEKSQG
ncbi:MAG: cyclic nucleotide-binding domain-containing protein [Acidobacteriota bacterium]